MDREYFSPAPEDEDREFPLEDLVSQRRRRTRIKKGEEEERVVKRNYWKSLNFLRVKISIYIFRRFRTRMSFDCDITLSIVR